MMCKDVGMLGCTKTSFTEDMYSREVCWMCNNTKRSKVRNDNVCAKVCVTRIEEKMPENRLRWFDYMRRKSTNVPVCRKELINVG